MRSWRAVRDLLTGDRSAAAQRLLAELFASEADPSPYRALVAAIKNPSSPGNVTGRIRRWARQFRGTREGTVVELKNGLEIQLRAQRSARGGR